MIQFTNTLTGKKEEFTPIQENKVSMYHCGPTVYDDAHIGNLRSYVLADLLRRLFDHLDYEVTQVMNVTDIGLLTEGDSGEDKMVKGLKRDGLEISIENMKKLGAKYTERFLDDLTKLNINHPTTLVPASSEVEEQINLIKTLDAKG
jgi:cysteinyl-tRNA synthetase